MADVAVNFAVKLLGVAVDEIKLLRGVREDMRWLVGELEWMRSFLLDAERRSSSGDEAVAKWVREITDAAYEAEDIAARFVPRRGLGFRATLRRYAFRLKELHDIGNDIKMLKEKMEDIGKRRERYGIRNIDSEANSSSSIDNAIHEWRRRPLYQSEENVIGLENDKRRVTELLLHADSRCCVIGIVGGGGMGKTTLAWKIFKSIDRSLFPKTARLDLSQNYIKNHQNPIHKLLVEIAKQVVPDCQQLDSKRTDELSELVKTNLKNRRYLIIMDDMWETDVWDLIKDHLPDVKNGSRIIITTRNANVAEHPALHFPPHRMEGLDERRSWDLFTRLVFEDEEHTRRDCTGQLKELAEELVGRCGGSPLALRVLGGLLAGKEKTCSAWGDVVGSKKWMREEGGGKNCMEILKLSYMDLPHHLKLCFLYLSAFPEDHDINVEKLIRLWVAEGFVVEPESHQKKTPGDVARTYLVDLEQRCLLRVHWEYEYYNPHDYITEYCRIHDMIRELSIDEAKKVNFMNFINEATKDRRENGAMHRLSLQGNFSSGVVDGESLRTLLNFARGQPIDFKRFCLLRVLDLDGARIHKLPEEVGDMVLLRYLSIKDTECTALPRSISRLSYLETLDCRTYNFDLVIPNKVWKMETLKHVYGISRLDEVDVSDIVKLQTLDFVMLASVSSSSIHHMINLQELSICGEGFYSEDPQSLPSSSWTALQSLPSLKFLTLFQLVMTDLVNTATGFPNLQRLKITDCKIESWEVQEGSMPSLVMLFLHKCYILKRLPRGLAYCTKLHNIHCNRMEPEFLKWYDTSKEDATWEFRGLAQYMTVLRGK